MHIARGHERGIRDTGPQVDFLLVREHAVVGIPVECQRQHQVVAAQPRQARLDRRDRFPRHELHSQSGGAGRQLAKRFELRQAGAALVMDDHHAPRVAENGEHPGQALCDVAVVEYPAQVGFARQFGTPLAGDAREQHRHLGIVARAHLQREVQRIVVHRQHQPGRCTAVLGQQQTLDLRVIRRRGLHAPRVQVVDAERDVRPRGLQHAPQAGNLLVAPRQPRVVGHEQLHALRLRSAGQHGKCQRNQQDDEGLQPPGRARPPGTALRSYRESAWRKAGYSRMRSQGAGVRRSCAVRHRMLPAGWWMLSSPPAPGIASCPVSDVAASSAPSA
jgi:hypothetical protein